MVVRAHARRPVHPRASGSSALTTPALSGRYEFGDTQVFVTNGAGFWGPIARLGADPDITMLTLQRA